MPHTMIPYTNQAAIPDHFVYLDWGSGFGSGTMIAPGVVMTAAHNVTDMNGNLNISTITMFPVDDDRDIGANSGPYGSSITGANNIFFPEAFGGDGDHGDDVALINFTLTSQQRIALSNGSIDIAAMLIFVDAKDAIGTAVTVTGMTGANPNGSPIVTHYDTGTISRIATSAIYGGEFWVGSSSLDGESGVSGGGYIGSYGGQTGVMGVHTGEVTNNADNTINPLDGKLYAVIASYLQSKLSAAELALIPDVTIVGDQGNSATSTIQGTGFNENIYVSDLSGNIVNSEGGKDTVYYTGISEGVVATIGATSVSVTRGNFNDTLNGIEAIQGTFQSDEFIIANFVVGEVLTINGNSNTTDQNQNTQNNVETVSAEGGDGSLSMLDGTEDTITISQTLLDAGARVSYFSDPGSGTIFLEQNGVIQAVNYAGIFNQPQQAPADYFWGSSGIGETEAYVGLMDDGSVLADFSNLGRSLTAEMQAAIPLWDLIDEVVGSSSDDIFEGGMGADALSGGGGNDTLYGDDAVALTGVEGQVFRAYQAVFDRAPDLGGFNAYSNAIRYGGMTLETAVGELASSAEFQQTYGNLNNTQFMQQLYLNVLDRPADAAGLNAFVGALNGGRSRASVIAEFAESTEFISLSAYESNSFANNVIISEVEYDVFRAYQAVLDRVPDAGGFEAFVNTIEGGGLSYTDAVAQFVNSAEFQATYGTLNNQQFVEQLYLNVLDRAGDSGGVAAYTGALNANILTRAQVVEEFSNSPEFRNNNYDNAVDFVRHFNANLSGFSDTLSGDAGADILYGGRGADSFEYDTTSDGADVILDFASGVDIISLSGSASFDSFTEIINAATQIGSNTVINFGGGNSLTLNNVAVADLTASDFGLLGSGGASSAAVSENGFGSAETMPVDNDTAGLEMLDLWNGEPEWMIDALI